MRTLDKLYERGYPLKKESKYNSRPAGHRKLPNGFGQIDEYAIKYLVGHSVNDLTEKMYTERDIEWLRDEINKIGGLAVFAQFAQFLGHFYLLYTNYSYMHKTHILIKRGVKSGQSGQKWAENAVFPELLMIFSSF